VTDATIATTTAPAPAPAPTPPPAKATPTLTPAEAATALAAKMGDKDFAAKYLAGDAAAKTEVGMLIRKKMEGDRIDAALSGVIVPGEPNVGGVSPANLLSAITSFRQVGISDLAIKEALNGQPVDKATFDRVMEFRSARLGDAEWVRRWMSGSRAERKEAYCLRLFGATASARRLPHEIRLCFY
jgi:hypothetical protein